MQTANTLKCSFSGVISIESKRFLDSGIALVECPECARMRSLSPHKGVLRFPSHDKRKTRTPIPIADGQWGKRPGKWLEDRESKVFGS